MANHPVDVYVGKRLRARRVYLGLSQENLGDAVGITFQQIQKYERGQNRIGSSRLYEFAKLLGASIGYFFEGFFEDIDHADPIRHLADEEIEFEHEAFKNKEVLTLVRAFNAIEDPLVRKKLLSLVKSMGDSSMLPKKGSDTPILPGKSGQLEKI